jgi:hypothetical protein
MMLDTCYHDLVATMHVDQHLATRMLEYPASGSYFVHKLYRTTTQEVFIQECRSRQGYFERHRFVLQKEQWDGGSRLIPGSHSWHPQRNVLTFPEIIDYE